VDAGNELAISDLLNELDQQVDHFNARGSGFSVERVVRFVVVVTKYRPLHASSYIETPEAIANKHCVINVQNTNDHKCFVYAILSCLFQDKHNPQRVSVYQKYERYLNMDGLNFPIQIRDIPKFERQNQDISINVLYWDEEENEFSIEYLSLESKRRHHVNLLLLSDGSNRHYVWIKNMSRLLGQRTNHQHATFVCNSCLNPFSSQRVLDEHMIYCLKNPPQAVKYPDPDDEDECIMKFRARKKQFQLPFYLVADFESFLSPVHDHDDRNYGRGMHIVNEHEVSGFACYRVTIPRLKEYQTDPVVYSGPNVMAKFYEHIMTESKEIAKIIGADLPMLPLTPEQQTLYNNATVCTNCDKPFTEKNKKVRHHCHLDGKFLFPCCNNCNLQLKITKTGRNGRKMKHGEEDYLENYFLPVVFHNLKSYDSHFVIKHFEKQYVEYVNGNGKVSYNDVDVIPLNSEKYVMFQIRNVRFLDSYQFLSTSLDELVSLLLKSGKRNFEHTTKFLGNDDLVFAKGIYPYNHMTSEKVFAETKLPPIKEFYNNLKNEALDNADYERAQATWDHFKIVNMKQYHDHYLVSDVLLLADVFENFRKSVYAQHRLDCLHFYTLPSLAWAMALKHTGVKLDLITDPEAYLMVEGNMRGGVATISQRHATANNPYVDGYNSDEPRRYITYLDANNLYGKAMSEPLPVGNFRFLTEDEIKNFDLKSVASDDDIGYFIECDIEYPPELHDHHNDYPLAAEHLTVTRHMLSSFAQGLMGSWKPSTKLIPNLMNKQKYVAHYRNLQFYENHGLIITKIHRILSFSQEAWLKPWIDFCTEQRMMATSDFESDLAKLQANATFGKTMEQVRNRVNVRLIADPDKILRATSKVNFRQAEIINDDLVMIKAARKKVTLNKPISVGFAILELSKLVMYEFYYDYLKVRYGNRCSLLFTDTDSLCCQIETHDLYEDMHTDLDRFDTSNFPLGHDQYSDTNHRVLGKFKSETGALAPKEFVGLRAKVYSLDVPDNPKQSKIRVKGVQKSYVKKSVRHNQFLNVLNRQTTTSSRFQLFRSTNHVIQTLEIEKQCLNAFDDKRYVLSDGIHTLAYGHYSISPSSSS